MNIPNTNARDYEKPIAIAEGIYWVGFFDEGRGLHCNPYLIVEGQEAVLIDGGSRSDFSSVMLKILQTGIDPQAIRRLIYHHYDPDLCGSLLNFEAIIGRNDLKIVSHRENNVFIRYYGASAPMVCIEDLHWEFQFATGRKLTFILTPYAHAAGNFVTFDQQTGTLFSSDLFGSYSAAWELFLQFPPECATCQTYPACPRQVSACPLLAIVDFHRRIMPSGKALRYAINQIKPLPLERIAPQHGSVLDRQADIQLVLTKLAQLQGIGIDAYGEEDGA